MVDTKAEKRNSIDEYIDTQSEEVRPLLQNIRETIRAGSHRKNHVVDADILAGREPHPLRGVQEAHRAVSRRRSHVRICGAAERLQDIQRCNTTAAR